MVGNASKTFILAGFGSHVYNSYGHLGVFQAVNFLATKSGVSLRDLGIFPPFFLQRQNLLFSHAIHDRGNQNRHFKANRVDFFFLRLNLRCILVIGLQR